MNEEFVIKLVTKHLDEQRKIDKGKFDQIFIALNLEQKNSVRECLHKYGIAVSDERNIKFDKINVIQVEKKPAIIQDYAQHKTLKNLSNEQLCVLYQQGSTVALGCLLENNQKLIWSRVIRYSGRYKHKLDEEDLIAFGNMGMMKAAEKYDIRNDNKFATYAIYWIDQSIMRSIADFGFTIRVPVHMFEAVNKVLRLKQRYMESSKEEFYQILQQQGINQDRYRQLMVVSQHILTIQSLNSLVGEDDETELGEFITDSHQLTVEELVEQNLLREKIEEVLEELTDKEKNILRLRFGLKDGVPRTLEQVGKVYGVTRERIRQIESKALSKLNHPSRRKKIEDYMMK